MTDDATPREVGSHAGLGPLPEPMSDYPEPGERTYTEAALLTFGAQERAAERERWRRDQQAWEDTRTQRDELLAHIAGKAPLPQWAADWLKA